MMHIIGFGQKNKIELNCKSWKPSSSQVQLKMSPKWALFPILNWPFLWNYWMDFNSVCCSGIIMVCRLLLFNSEHPCVNIKKWTEVLTSWFYFLIKTFMWWTTQILTYKKKNIATYPELFSSWLVILLMAMKRILGQRMRGDRWHKFSSSIILLIR